MLKSLPMRVPKIVSEHGILRGHRTEIASAMQVVQQVSSRFKEMCEEIPADSLEELRNKIKQGLERFRLQKRSTELGIDLIRRLGQDSITASLAILNEKVGTSESLDAVKTRCEALERDLEDIDQQVSELYASWQKLKHELSTIGADSTVAKLVEEREAVLLEIKSKAHDFIVGSDVLCKSVLFFSL